MNPTIWRALCAWMAQEQSPVPLIYDLPGDGEGGPVIYVALTEKHEVVFHRAEKVTASVYESTDKRETTNIATVGGLNDFLELVEAYLAAPVSPSPERAGGQG